MIMNWDSSHDPRCSLLLTDPWYSVTIRVLVSVTGWRDSKHLWNSCLKRKDHLTDGILPRDDARFIDSNIYTGFIIRGIHHVCDLSITNKFLPLTGWGPGNVRHIPCGGGDLMVTPPQVTSVPSCWPLHTLEISPHWKLALVSDW